MGKMEKVQWKLCDKNMPVKLNGKIHSIALTPTLVYGVETLSTTKRQEKRLQIQDTVYNKFYLTSVCIQKHDLNRAII